MTLNLCIVYTYEMMCLTNTVLVATTPPTPNPQKNKQTKQKNKQKCRNKHSFHSGSQECLVGNVLHIFAWENHTSGSEGILDGDGEGLYV